MRDDRWDEAFILMETLEKPKHLVRFTNALIRFKKNQSKTKFIVEVCVLCSVCWSLSITIGENGPFIGMGLYVFREVFTNVFIDLMVAIILTRIFKKDA